MKFDEIQTSITNKLGEENSSMIADDMANLITLNTNHEQTITNLNEEITKLKKDKETLITANGNLLQKIGVQEESILKPKKDEDEVYTPFDFSSVYDEKGNFKKKL